MPAVLEPQIPSRSLAPLRAARQSGCVVCGPDHPHGLRIPYRVDAAGVATAEWTPTRDWEGFEGIVHGGIVSTVLDEAMSQAVAAGGCEALTAELRVRLRHRVSPGEPLLIRGWIVRRARRLIETEAALTGRDGVVRAHAWASFLALLPKSKETSSSENSSSDQ
jgi:acyl-coenzyme A thioesterase PaaI-like protein